MTAPKPPGRTEWPALDLAWMAGLLEGEGSFYMSDKARIIKVGMTDADVIEKFHRLSGIGTTYDRSRTDEAAHYKHLYVWQSGRAAEQEPFLKAIRPYMGARRGAKIDLMLAVLEGMKHRNTCEICGAEFITYSRPAQFCTAKSSCRASAYARKHGVNRERKAELARIRYAKRRSEQVKEPCINVCEWCGTEFTATRRSRFCTDKSTCRRAAWYASKKQE